MRWSQSIFRRTSSRSPIEGLVSFKWNLPRMLQPPSTTWYAPHAFAPCRAGGGGVVAVRLLRLPARVVLDRRHSERQPVPLVLTRDDPRRCLCWHGMPRSTSQKSLGEPFASTMLDPRKPDTTRTAPSGLRTRGFASMRESRKRSCRPSRGRNLPRSFARASGPSRPGPRGRRKPPLAVMPRRPSARERRIPKCTLT